LNNFQNSAPTLRCRPDLVHGMPVARDTRRFAFVTPNWRFQLQPPLFIAVHLPEGCTHVTDINQPSHSLKENRADKQAKREDKRPGFGH
jgi:hypothetical protein